MPSKVWPILANINHRSLIIRDPPHTYFHLILVSASAPTLSLSLPGHTYSPTTLDILTARSYFSSALQQYLGLTGSAMPIDILKVEGRDFWIRVPREDGPAVAGALSQWISNRDGGAAWKISSKGEWLGRVAIRNEENLFKP